MPRRPPLATARRRLLAAAPIAAVVAGLVLSDRLPERATAADAGLTEERVEALARSLTPHLSANEPGPLWAAFDQSMRIAMGDSARFATTLAAIHADVGGLEEVLDEEIASRDGTWVYRARCRFEKASGPLQVIFAFTTEGEVAGLSVRPQPEAYRSTKLDYEQRTELRLPFEGEWTVFWGGRTLEQNTHAVSKSQRFAIDFLVVRNGMSHEGTGDDLEDYYAFGREILAPAAGRVVSVVDSLPDQRIGRSDPANPYGNVVVIEHEAGEHSVLAHLRTGSIRVRVGDRVEPGRVVGLCGNSGNTSEPHLHFQLQDGPDLHDAEGLPVRFGGVVVDGAEADVVEPVKGQTVRPVE